MTWLATARLLLSIVDGIVARAREKGWIEAGKNEQLVVDLKAVNERIKRALHARTTVSDDPDSVLNDPYNRG